MNKLPGPSKDWREQVGLDEAERFESHARRFAQIQARKSARWGKGRALHRKALTAAHGTLEVLDSVPIYAKHGLFAHPRDYEVLVRLSNGGMDRASDRSPDVRGFAMRVMGVQGESALGNGPALSQDFTLINHETFSFADSQEFVDFVDAAAGGGASLLRHALRRYGLLGAPRVLARMARTAGKRFAGFANEPLHSVLPMANGPYAVRVRLVPSASNGDPDPQAGTDWGADFARRLAKAPLHWDFQMQYFASEALTPIENPTVNWPTPWSTVARLMLPRQDCAGAEGQALASRIEAGVIDPWQALAEHRPLGELQRARKVVYYQSQRGRDAV